MRKFIPRDPQSHQGDDQQVDRDRSIARFHLRKARLARAQEFGDLRLCPTTALTLALQRCGERELDIDEQRFLGAQGQEILRRTDLPASGPQLPFLGCVRDALSPTAVADQTPGRIAFRMDPGEPGQDPSSDRMSNQT